MDDEEEAEDADGAAEEEEQNKHGGAGEHEMGEEMEEGDEGDYRETEEVEFEAGADEVDDGDGGDDRENEDIEVGATSFCLWAALHVCTTCLPALFGHNKPHNHVTDAIRVYTSNGHCIAAAVVITGGEGGGGGGYREEGGGGGNAPAQSHRHLQQTWHDVRRRKVPVLGCILAGCSCPLADGAGGGGRAA